MADPRNLGGHPRIYTREGDPLPPPPGPTHEEKLIRNLRNHFINLKNQNTKTIRQIEELRFKQDSLASEVGRLDDILSAYDADVKREELAAKQSATNTAPAHVGDPTEVMHKEAKESWDAAWHAAESYWGMPSRSNPIHIRSRDTAFNAYLKEQGGA